MLHSNQVNFDKYSVVYKANGESFKITHQHKVNKTAINHRAKCLVYQNKDNKQKYVYTIEDQRETNGKKNNNFPFTADKLLDISHIKQSGKKFTIVIKNSQLIGTLETENDAVKISNLFRRLQGQKCVDKENIHTPQYNSPLRTGQVEDNDAHKQFSKSPSRQKMALAINSSTTPIPKPKFSRIKDPTYEDIFNDDDYDKNDNDVNEHRSNNSFTEKSVQEKTVKNTGIFTEQNNNYILSIVDKNNPYNSLGFSNLGNSCYMNSILQCLLNIPSFHQDLNRNKPTTENDIFYKSLRFLSLLQHSQFVQDISAKVPILKQLEKIVSTKDGNFQEDAHEFWCKLLDKVKSELNDKKTCPVDLNFLSKVKHTITCDGCRNEVTTTQDFNHFSLILPMDSEIDEDGDIADLPIISLITSYFANEIIEYMCEKCGAKTSTLSHEFEQLPRLLVFHIKRYDLTEDKRCDRITLDESLDVDNWTSALTQQPPLFVYNDKQSESDNELCENIFDEPTTKKFRNDNKTLYTLVGAVNHHGSRKNNGHYSANICELSTKKWLTCNDTYVRKISKHEVRYGASSTSYIIFYMHQACYTESVC